MKTIKFSHEYKKLTSALDMIAPAASWQATLLQVFEIDLKDLSPEMRAYDTDDGLFKLPRAGKYLLLIFEVNGVLFTTIRSAWPERKIDYYKNAVGETFLILITPPTND